jgi:dTDP-4-dehydrorhamnose reductase
MSTVLVTGATGFLGPYLVEAFAALGSVEGVARGPGATHQSDLTDDGAVERLLGSVRPDVVVHAAALTDVDLCENNPAQARRFNGDATGNVVRHLPQGASLVYVSTDQVYPGSGAPHVEGSEAPVNVYGATKLAGEQAALRHPKTTVLRTNLFGVSRTRTGASLVDFLVGRFKGLQPVSLFTDVMFSPLHVMTMASLAVECVRRDLTGTFNLGSREGTSKCDFAFAVARHLGLPTDHATPAASASLPGRAPRPMDMRMDPSRIEKALGMAMPNLNDEIEKL